MTMTHRYGHIDSVAAPMSFAGSGNRILNVIREHDIQNAWVRALAWTGIIFAVMLAWIVVLVWYLTFGLLLVPYRIVRRSQRKQNIQDRKHHELLESIQSTNRPRR
jgi:hypothetical protein